MSRSQLSQAVSPKAAVSILREVHPQKLGSGVLYLNTFLGYLFL